MLSNLLPSLVLLIFTSGVMTGRRPGGECEVCVQQELVAGLELKVSTLQNKLDTCQDKMIKDALQKIDESAAGQSLLGKACSSLGSLVSGGGPEKQFRAFLTDFLRITNLLEGQSSEGHVTEDFSLRFSRQDLDKLRKYALFEEGRPSDAHSILIQAIGPRSPSGGWLAVSGLRIPPHLAVLAMASLFLFCIIVPFYMGARKRLIVFVVCCYVVLHTWVGEYWRAVAKKEAVLAKHGPSMARCRLENKGLGNAVAEFFSGLLNGKQDPCEEYFRAAMVDPALEVNLVQALVETFSQCLAVLGGLGTAIGNFYTNLLAPLPLLWKLPILLLSLVVTVIVILVVGGCRIRLPFITLDTDRKSGSRKLPAGQENRGLESREGNRNTSKHLSAADDQAALPYPAEAAHYNPLKSLLGITPDTRPAPANRHSKLE